jgi:FkbM family methyltransferase
MRIATGETVSNGLAAFGYAEEAITALFCHLLKPGSVVVDVGTHFGYEALLACHLVGPTGLVVAFEPNPAARAFAARNLAEAPAAVLLPYALGAADGSAAFPKTELTASAFAGFTHTDGPTFPVEVRRLDSLHSMLRRPVNVVKCDAENHETEVLHGAEALIARDLPVIVLETGFSADDGAPHPRALALGALVQPLGYSAYAFDFAGRLQIAPLGALRCGHANTLYLPPHHPLRASL